MYNTFYIDSANVPNLGLSDISSEGIITASYLLVTNASTSLAPIPFSLLQLSAIENAPTRMLLDTCNNDDNLFGSSIRGRRIRGTYSSPEAVQKDDIFLQVTADAYDGNTFSSNNSVCLYRAAEHWTTSSHGTYVQFKTTLLGEISNSVSLQIGSDGLIYGNFTGSLIGTSSYATSASWSPSTVQIHIEKGLVSGSNFTGTPKSFDIIYSNAYSNTNYIVSVLGDDMRVWSTYNRSTTGFTINSNSNTPINGMVMWRVEEI